MLADTMKPRESVKNDDVLDLLMDIIDRGRSICGQPKLNPSELDSTAEANQHRELSPGFVKERWRAIRLSAGATEQRYRKKFFAARVRIRVDTSLP